MKTILDNPINIFREKIDIKTIKVHPLMNKYQRFAKIARSILSQQASAIEMLLLEPVIDFSDKNFDLIKMVLYQFDGFSLTCTDKSKQERKCKELKNILDRHINILDYPATFEYKENK